MFSKIRKRFTYTNVAMTLALVFAMTGGAYAASKYVITSTKQISPKVLKSLKGAKGANGANGAAGAAGPAGAAGATGPGGPAGTNGTGTEGKEGKEGKGKEGKQGIPGIPGANGEPWTAGGTLPSGKTEYGTWNDFGNTENGKIVAASISFTLPVENAAKEPPQGEFVYATKTGAHCTGSVSEPTAPTGYLCVYDAFKEEEGTPTYHVKLISLLDPEEALFGTHSVGKKGTLLQFETREIGNGGVPFTVAWGTWAVTAE
jgi:hypothetical protein